MDGDDNDDLPGGEGGYGEWVVAVPRVRSNGWSVLRPPARSHHVHYEHHAHHSHYSYHYHHPSFQGNVLRGVPSYARYSMILNDFQPNQRYLHQRNPPHLLYQSSPGVDGEAMDAGEPREGREPWSI